jgi:hypothetical protein
MWGTSPLRSRRDERRLADVSLGNGYERAHTGTQTLSLSTCFAVSALRTTVAGMGVLVEVSAQV